MKIVNDTELQYTTIGKIIDLITDNLRIDLKEEK